MKPSRQDKAAGGLEALLSAWTHTLHNPGLLRGAKSYSQLNQSAGFDCPGCAWPDPDDRAAMEFCEQGIKAVAHEATRKCIDANFFAQHSISELLERDDCWLEQQGRLAQPLIKRPGSDRYTAISWEDAFARIGQVLRGLTSPDQAIFYTSGRTSNEAAFLYQLFVREFGTNNMPDCSNMCHESSGTGLSEVIGVGKGTVTLRDFELADAIFLLGQNPGSNHPRMLATLQMAKQRGCKIVAINPLRERGLVRFSHPKNPLELMGRSTPIADLFLQVRVGGDIPLIKAIMKQVLAAEATAPHGALDWDFIRRHTLGFDELRAELDGHSSEELAEECGVALDEIRQAAQIYCESKRVIICWAMGLTQHEHGVANVQELVNLLLLRGNIGKAGAGPCPVRGHSNVQGDRTMGIWERPTASFLESLGKEFGFEPPKHHGLDTVAAIEAMHSGTAQVFISLGGNFAVASPDTTYTEAALRKTQLNVHVATKLNRSHLISGNEAILLPCLGRSERDVQASGTQFVSVENSMSIVHASQGSLEPVSTELLSEPAIVAGMASATLGSDSRVPWQKLVANYDRIRERIERVIPGFEDFNTRVRKPGGFVLPSGARERRFDTDSGKAHFTIHAVPRLALEPNQYLMMTIRSHDQYNTTVYGTDDRYRGISGGRRVVMMRPEEMESAGLHDGAQVTLTSHFRGERRSVSGFRVVPFEVPRRCVAAYFPETNGLVPIGSFADKSRTPAYKSVIVSLALDQAAEKKGSSPNL